MPSLLHEALVHILRDNPNLVAELLRRAGTPGIPAHDTIVSDSADLGAVIPRELAADCVLRFEQSGETVLVVVLEVQLAVDPDKQFTWPAYCDGARLRHRCDGMLVVVTPSRAVADWARQPIRFGPGSGFLQPYVIGPAETPAITDADEASLLPELAVLSAIAHGQDDDVARATAIADTALRVVFALSGDRAQLYYDHVWAALSGAARKALEMLPQNHEYQHEGLRRAKAEGLAEGEARGKAQSLLDVLAARGLLVTPDQRAKIVGCTDLDQLSRWLHAAVAANSTNDVLGD